MNSVSSLSSYHQAQHALRRCDRNISISMIDGACEQDPHYVTARDGHTVIMQRPVLNTSRGDPRSTGRALDACINSSEGWGWYIKVHDAEERELARRTINLQPDAEGRLCADGYPVLGDGGGYIEVPQDSVKQELKSDGKVVSVGRDGKSTTLGTIMLAQWQNEQGLEPVGNNCFLPTESAGDQVTATPGSGAPRLITQHLESSNVDLKKQADEADRARSQAELAVKLEGLKSQMDSLPTKILLGGG